ncbi:MULTISPECIES: hypothetical protein [unclassified Acinetobacter]|uniref:hypothetical protein n=1 Tax=unclassified Acinetobacter TaxID=196816 RepID=UPI0029346AA5|nr:MULTISPECIES: hypothetical protein [unclassified Acinetobacter]WOE32279.1 hypothetical protein QSG84_03455 [Acinetobacter sp. SAAs470]WOE37750.1 hypothetical protein QSG86_12500 [Acinetobacter sp. SAAs474]
MNFRFINNDNLEIHGECEQDLNISVDFDRPLTTIIDQSISIEAVAGEMSFYKKIASDLFISVLIFAVDNEGNVFDADHFPDLSILGTQWSIIDKVI